MSFVRRVIAVDELCDGAGMDDGVQRDETVQDMFRIRRHSDGEGTYLPGCSGILTLRRTSLPSPSSARSATNRKRSKFMFAPLTTTTNFFRAPISSLSMIWRFKPAKARAPAGSVIERVSVLPCQTGNGPWTCAISLTLEYILDSGAKLIIVNFDDTVEELFAYPERLFANDFHGCAVTERPNFR